MTEREELARIIDPEAWADWDAFHDVEAVPNGVDWPKLAHKRVAPSLAKANLWLSRPSPVDGLKASLDEATSATMMAEMRADKLMAEVERLKGVTSVSLLSRLSEAEAEIARLREALTKIRAVRPEIVTHVPEGFAPVLSCQQIASDALQIQDPTP